MMAAGLIACLSLCLLQPRFHLVDAVIRSSVRIAIISAVDLPTTTECTHTVSLVNGNEAI